MAPLGGVFSVVTFAMKHGLLPGPEKALESPHDERLKRVTPGSWSGAAPPSAPRMSSCRAVTADSGPRLPDGFEHLLEPGEVGRHRLGVALEVLVAHAGEPGGA